MVPFFERQERLAATLAALHVLRARHQAEAAGVGQQQRVLS